MDDTISRQAAIAAIDKWKNDFKGYVNALNIPRDDYNGIMEYIDELPSAQTLCGYDIEYLMLIADVLRKENLPPERVTDALTDIGRIVSMIRDEVRDEFEKTLQKSMAQLFGAVSETAERRTDD